MLVVLGLFSDSAASSGHPRQWEAQPDVDISMIVSRWDSHHHQHLSAVKTLIVAASLGLGLGIYDPQAAKYCRAHIYAVD